MEVQHRRLLTKFQECLIRVFTVQDAELSQLEFSHKSSSIRTAIGTIQYLGVDEPPEIAMFYTLISVFHVIRRTPFSPLRVSRHLS